MIKILGLSGLFAAIASGIAGETAGVALGGFIGLVVGFATQQVLGQAIAGMFLLLTVKEIGVLFTRLEEQIPTVFLYQAR